MKHPAKYTDNILPVMAEMLVNIGNTGRGIDPFAGTGKGVDYFRLLGFDMVGVEIEPEWANLSPYVIVGNALHLPFPDNTFDFAAFSPCYGNRMADHHKPRDQSRRITYKHYLGRDLHADNAGAMQWGKAYIEFHTAAYEELDRVLKPYGRIVLNIKDHKRRGVEQKVPQWHRDALRFLGYRMNHFVPVDTPGMRFGSNYSLRCDVEYVALFTKRPAEEW